MSGLSLEQQVKNLEQSLEAAWNTIAVLSAQLNESDRHLQGLQHQIRAHHGEISELRLRVDRMEKREA